jgi:DNA-binding transcriptional LysR family regulator
MINPQRLRLLREVVDRGSFSAAADALSYTQSAVSQSIAALEAELGTTLLERNRRGARPTSAGAALVAHADAILAHLDAAEAEVAAIAGVRGGQLAMASFPTAGATIVPLAVATFRQGHPDVALSLTEGEPEEVTPRLGAGEFDLALLFEFEGARERIDRGLRRIDLLADPMYLALPDRHPLADAPRIRLRDLSAESWVQTSVTSPCARHVVRSCHAAGFEPTVSFETDDYQTVQGLVAAGVGVALIPQLALSTVRGDITIRALHPRAPVRTVLAATTRPPGASPAADRMLDVLADVSRRYGRGKMGPLT